MKEGRNRHLRERAKEREKREQLDRDANRTDRSLQKRGGAPKNGSSRRWKHGSEMERLLNLRGPSYCSLYLRGFGLNESLGIYKGPKVRPYKN